MKFCKLNIVLFQPQMKTQNITRTPEALTCAPGHKDLVTTTLTSDSLDSFYLFLYVIYMDQVIRVLL